MGRSRKPTNARLRRLRAHRRFIGRNRPHGSNMIPVCANIGSQHLVKYALQVASSSNASYARRRCGRQERDFSRQSQVPRKPPITPNRYPVHCAATRGAEQSASQRLSVRLNCAFARNRSGSPGPISHLRFCSPEVRHIRPTSRMSASPTRGRTCAPALVSSSIVAIPLPSFSSSE